MQFFLKWGGFPWICRLIDDEKEESIERGESIEKEESIENEESIEKEE